MSRFIQIQESIFVEKCIICGTRPVIEQKAGKFIVRCKTSNDHYQTKPGLVDIDSWNRHNHKPGSDNDNIRHLKQG